ncbi:MAG: translation initiation factor IF-2 N-terminal domain-containing protein [Clostridia bacterium]|nr:translation initiation factor IF-2 N-terminal domain-containing protein [Clostridia bacterium]
MAAVKIKISALTKELNVDKNEVLELLKTFGSKVKSAQSSIETKELDIIFEHFTQKYKVEEFDFFKTDDRPKEKETSKSAKKEKKPEEIIEDIKEDLEEKPIEKKSRYIDTRAVNVDLDKFDTEKIEELVPKNIDANKTDKKQKIKKNKNANKFDNKADVIQKEKKEKKEVVENVVVYMGDEISVGEFAEKLGRPSNEVVKCLMMIGVMASVSQNIDFDTASLIATEFNATVEKEVIVTEEDILFKAVEDNEED